MPRQRNIGKIEPTPKIWLSKKEVAAYLGVTERFVDENINKRPDSFISKFLQKVVRTPQICFCFGCV